MTREVGDTRERSLAHWSEKGRDEMDAFYRVATLDYRMLAEAWDWWTFFEDRRQIRSPVRILDVACGSGKFPTALHRHTRLGESANDSLLLDLLDPSPFSLREARAALRTPMVGGADFECGLEDLPPTATGYDVVWAVHALYALPESQLANGVSAFLRALHPDGLGFVAHATKSSHYLAFYDAYLAHHRPDGTPFTSAETVAAAFRAAGARVETRTIHYDQVIDDEEVLEGFLQRCLFDSTLSLAQMRADEALGAYLARCETTDGRMRFRQDVSMLFIRR